MGQVIVFFFASQEVCAFSLSLSLPGGKWEPAVHMQPAVPSLVEQEVLHSLRDLSQYLHKRCCRLQRLGDSKSESSLLYSKNIHLHAFCKRRGLKYRPGYAIYAKVLHWAWWILVVPGQALVS